MAKRLDAEISQLGYCQYHIKIKHENGDISAANCDTVKEAFRWAAEHGVTRIYSMEGTSKPVYLSREE